MSDRMRFSEMAGIATEREDMQSIWPLNVVLALLGMSVLGVAFAFLDIDDPRPLYNPWSYAIATPMVFLLLSLLLSTVVSRVVEKSMQMAFLLSVLIHLVLMVAAVNVVIFSRMWPDVLDALAAQREMLKRDQLQAKQYHRLSSTTQSGMRPDYLKPVETEHQPTEVETVNTPRLALARSELANLVSPSPSIERSHTPHLLQRDQPVTSTPSSSEQAAKLSRSEATVPRVDPAAPLLQPRESAELDVSEPPPLLPAPTALARSDSARSDLARSDLGRISDALPIPSPPDIPLNASARQNLPTEQRRELASPAPTPNLSDLAMSLPRSTAGGTVGAEAPKSMPIQGMEAVGVSDPLPSQEIVLGSQATQPRRASPNTSRTSQLPLLGAPQSPRADELHSFSSGLSGRSPAQLAQSQADGTAATQDVAGLHGAERELQRSSLGRSGRPGATTVTGLQAVQDQLAAELSAGAGSGMAPASAALSRRNTRQGQSTGQPAVPSTMLNVDQMAGPGGISATPDQVGGLLNRRNVALDNWAPPQLETQRFARQDVGGPLAAGQVALPKPAFQQRIDRLQDQHPQDESTLAPQTELAIERGLEFLAKHQRPDGSWRLQDFDTPVLIHSDTAATGLALLAFQGAGYTHNQFKYATTVTKAIEFLVQHQQPNGDLYIPQNPASDQNAWLYSHAIAALALSEAVGMTQDDQLRPAAQRAIDFMVASQDPQLGGWRYRPGAGADTSVTGWFMMAFKSGQLAGLNVPQTSFDAIEKFVVASQGSSEQPHLYRYNPFAADTPQQRHGLVPTSVMTSVGLLMRLYFGWQRDRAEMMAGADHLLAHPPENGSLSASRRDTYYWYYATQVMFHMRGDRWKAWHDTLYPLLLNSQIVEGEMAGSWDPNYPTPDLWARYGGRLYVTTLNLLSLEVSYRHLPLYEAASQ